MRTWEQLTEGEQWTAKLLAQDTILEGWLADPFHVFPAGSEGDVLLLNAVDGAPGLGKSEQRANVMADPALLDYLEAEAIWAAEHAYYAGATESVHKTAIIDLVGDKMFMVTPW
jgi:hypothetical protein